MGQCCCAGSRTFVQEGIYDEFVKKATVLASKKKVGDQFDPNTEMGPLVKLKITSLLFRLFSLSFYLLIFYIV